MPVLEQLWSDEVVEDLSLVTSRDEETFSKHLFLANVGSFHVPLSLHLPYHQPKLAPALSVTVTHHLHNPLLTVGSCNLHFFNEVVECETLIFEMKECEAKKFGEEGVHKKLPSTW